MELILDTCRKTAFTFYNNSYEQKGGVSMGSSLGLILANFLMRESEKVIVDNAVKEETIKFYFCYVNDTIQVFYGLEQNVKCTVDKSENEASPYFVDLKICHNVLKIFEKALTL